MIFRGDAFTEQHEDPQLELERKRESTMETFYEKFFETDEAEIVKISLETLKELKEQGISTERFLDYLCKKHGVLLHGSTHEITDDHLKSRFDRIFASDKAAIAIMRSLYSNRDVNLQYPYTITEEYPLELTIHTPPDGTFIKIDRGFIYLVDNSGFVNEPKKTWQFKRFTKEVKIRAVIETEDDDFHGWILAHFRVLPGHLRGPARRRPARRLLC